MELLLAWLSGILLALGTLALLVGALGLVRLPNLFSRIHAVGMMDTAGVAFITLGMLIHEGFSLVSVKLAVVGIFLFFTSPIATHAVAKVAYKSGFSPLGEKPLGKTKVKAAKRKVAQEASRKKVPAAEKTRAKKAVVKKATAKKIATKIVAEKKAATKTVKRTVAETAKKAAFKKGVP